MHEKMYYDNIMRFIFFVNTISLIQERKFVHSLIPKLFREIRYFIRHNGQKTGTRLIGFIYLCTLDCQITRI